MSNLVGNPEDRFSHNEAHIIYVPLVSTYVQNSKPPAGMCEHTGLIKSNPKDKFSVELAHLIISYFQAPSPCP